MTLGKRIREQREMKGWNHRELAEKAGIRRFVIAQIETDQRVRINSEWLGQLADAFGVSTDFLLGRVSCACTCGDKEKVDTV